MAAVGLLINAAFDGIHHREYLHATHQGYTRPPFAIVVQCLIGLLAGTWGVVSGTGALQPIRIASNLQPKNFDFYAATPAFLTFNHRSFR